MPYEFGVQVSIATNNARARAVSSAARQAERRPAQGGSPGIGMREQRAELSRGNDVAKAMGYMLKRWTAFTLFPRRRPHLPSNNAAERGVRGIALGHKSWLFCGSDRGGERAAVMYSLIVTAKMNDIDPQA
jgi:hypothetical protein